MKIHIENGPLLGSWRGLQMMFQSILIEIKFLLLVRFDEMRETDLRKIFSYQRFRLLNSLRIIKWSNVLFLLLNYWADWPLDFQIDIVIVFFLNLFFLNLNLLFNFWTIHFDLLFDIFYLLNIILVFKKFETLDVKFGWLQTLI